MWVRFPCNIQTSCQPAGGGSADPAERLSVRVHDISRGGVSLVAARPFDPGQLLSLELPGAGPEGTTVLACVVRADPADGGQWTLGCTFSAELSDEDLQLFGARRARPTAPDQRNWVRYSCQAHASFRVVRSDSPEWWSARVLNISASGIALEVSAPLTVGELLSLELRRADDEVVLTTLAGVVRVTAPPPSAGDAERVVGCNFIAELGEKELDALL